METLKLTCLELATWSNVSILISCGALENRKFKNQVGPTTKETMIYRNDNHIMIDREPVGKHHEHDPFAPFIFPALSLGQPPPPAKELLELLTKFHDSKNLNSEDLASKQHARRIGIESLTHKSQKKCIPHMSMTTAPWSNDPSTRTSESHRERMKITGSSLNQMHECIVPILQIWIWNIESTRSMIGLIWVDFARLRGSFYTSGIRLHQLHLVARWITLANIAWQSCERNKSSNSQLFNWYELHWIAIFAMIYFQHRGFLGARVNARVAYF